MVEYRGDDRSGLDEDLRMRSPFNERRMPSAERIRNIQDKVQEPRRRGRRRLLWGMSGAIAACILIIAGLFIINDIPGGLSDRKLSHATGSGGIYYVPIGSTPEEALEKFRRQPNNRVIYQEAVPGGALLFTQRNNSRQQSDLQVDYIRHTWLGWKWGWGGGYGLTHGSPSQAKLEYMSLPELKGLDYPFPFMFGIVRDSSITRIDVNVGGQQAGYSAKIIPLDSGGTIWYVLLPKPAELPYRIEAFDSEDLMIASKTITDSQDNGEIEALNNK